MQAREVGPPACTCRRPPAAPVTGAQEAPLGRAGRAWCARIMRPRLRDWSRSWAHQKSRAIRASCR